MAAAAAVKRGMTWGAAACAVLLAAGAAWNAGFAAFDHMARKVSEPPPHADAIVALTGGADRIETALRLLIDGRAPSLLVSGVGRGADMAELARRMALTADQELRVTLGREATTTLGNAAETAAWVQAHGVHSLIVVTAGYHMPRAMIELRRALPEVTLYPMPVQSPALRRGVDVATLRVMAIEYDKYLAVRLGFTRHAKDRVAP